MQSETPKKYIEKLFSEALLGLSARGEIAALPSFELSVPNFEFGDYATNVALKMAKTEKKNPKDVASMLIEAVRVLDTDKNFKSIEQAAGFINITLSHAYVVKQMQQILELGDLYGCSLVGSGKKILVEYFQPNMAKPLHLGHLRTAIIGDSIFKILASQGYKVESDTHLGDWGTQFGLLILAFKKYGSMEVIEKDPIVELNKLYVQINSEVENNAALRDEGKSEFIKLEQGDEENKKLWKQFRDWSWQEYNVVYSDLGVRRSDHDWPESFYEDKMPSVVQALKDKGLLVESQGAQIVNLETYGLGVAVVVKSDGGTTYLLRDLATCIFRKSQGFEKQIYVVDVRQHHTLAQTFKILELLGEINSETDVLHVAYGFLTLPEGAMSTRKGTVVGAKEFIQSVQKEALQNIEEKNPALKEKHTVALHVAAAAIKYFDLSHNLKSDIVFDPKSAISFEGNTGPYLQYTHARIHGILRKVHAQNLKQDFSMNADHYAFNDHELSVLRKLSKYSDTVLQVSRDLLPNVLCNYLFELAQQFNSFYADVPVLAEQDESARSIRLGIISATAQVIKNGLGLLGIEAPEEM